MGAGAAGLCCAVMCCAPAAPMHVHVYDAVRGEAAQSSSGLRPTSGCLVRYSSER